MNVAGQFPFFERAAGNEPASVSVLQVRDFLSREWPLILTAIVLSLALGSIYITVSPLKYTASLDMAIDAKRVKWVQSEPSFEDRLIEDAAVDSEIEATKSENVSVAVIRRLNLVDDPEFVAVGPSLIDRVFSFFDPEPQTAPTQDQLLRRAIRHFARNLQVNRVGRSYVERIAFTSLDKEKAARIANAVGEAYIEDQLKAKFEATRRASEWLQQRIAELRQQATDAYKAVQDYKSQNNVIVGTDGKLASETETDQLGVALAKARADTSQARAKLERIEKVLEQRPTKENFKIPDPVVTDALNSPVITKLRQQFLDNQSKESEISARYGYEHQAARNLRANMWDTQRAIWDELSRIAESYKSELQITKSQEDAIEKRLTEVFNKSASTRQAQVHLRELQTAADSYRGIYETFLSRFTQSVQQQSFPSTEARVMTAASPPALPSWPKGKLVLALAALCGLCVGVAVAFVREQMNRRIQTRAQIEGLVGVGCLAVFPQLAREKRRIWKRKGSEAFQSICNAPPFSPTAEALRHIKVAIDLHPKSSKVVGVISALPGEGKTTIAISFAAFAASNGARTLLIDGDLRRPSMTKALGYAGQPGLFNLVTEGSGLADLLVTDSKLKFDLLPSSTKVRPANSFDILNSSATREMLKTAKDKYDYVLVDLPPVLPIVDVKAAADLFDAFILVVEWGSTSAEEVLKTIQASQLISERLIGTVLNKTDETTMRRMEGYTDRRYDYYARA
jgi:exopolysaccharide transport family protein